MKSLFIALLLLTSRNSFSKESWHSNKPIAEYYHSMPGRLGRIDNTLSILVQPKVREGYDDSLEFSINKYLPHTKARHISRVNNEIIYDQFYEFGHLSLRTIPKYLVIKNSTKHLIVAGDSNTFGDGVSIENTLPVLLSKKLPATTPYNWGIRGGGPNNTLALMEFFPWEKTIKESKGLFIYNYYDFLIERVIGFKSYIHWTDGFTPYYDLNSHGVATYQGNFNQRFLTKIFKIMNSVEWISDLLPILPRPSHEHSVILSKVFLKMYETYKTKFPQGQFYVAINYNFHHSLPGRLDALQAELRKNKVPFFVVPNVTYSDEYLFKDFHLNIKGHQLEADLFSKALSQVH